MFIRRSTFIVHCLTLFRAFLVIHVVIHLVNVHCLLSLRALFGLLPLEFLSELGSSGQTNIYLIIFFLDFLPERSLYLLLWLIIIIILYFLIIAIRNLNLIWVVLRLCWLRALGLNFTFFKFNGICLVLANNMLLTFY